MKLYRFDPSAGSAVDAYGSNFVLPRLAGSDSTSLRAACFHLEPGGVVGRHRATAGQLFCVLAGDGWVAGEDGERRVCRHLPRRQRAGVRGVRHRKHRGPLTWPGPVCTLGAWR